MGLNGRTPQNMLGLIRYRFKVGQVNEMEMFKLSEMTLAENYLYDLHRVNGKHGDTLAKIHED